jgi:tetratricopeptide (TPR) repeat protein
MSNVTSIITLKRPWSRELLLAVLIHGFSIFNLIQNGHSYINWFFLFATVAVAILLFYRRHTILTKIFFDNDQVTIHLNQKAICIRYYEIDKIRVVELLPKKAWKVQILTNKKKVFNLESKYFNLGKVKQAFGEHLRKKQIESVFFLLPAFYHLIHGHARIYKSLYWDEFIPPLRFSNIIQSSMILLSVLVLKTVHNEKTKEIFAAKKSEILQCQGVLSESCITAATVRAKFYFDVDEKGLSSIETEKIKLEEDHHLVLNVLEFACENKKEDSCFLLSLIYAKINDWSKSLAYFEKSLEHSKGQKVSMLGENVPSEEYYATRYNNFNKGSRVLASEEFKELASRHRKVRIEIAQ